MRAKLAELAALVEGGALNAERTRAYLAGELEAAPMDSDEIPTSIRLPRRLLDVADTLAAARAARTGERASRSAVLRVALERGIAALEREAAELDAPTTKAAILAELETLRERVAAMATAPPRKSMLQPCNEAEESPTYPGYCWCGHTLIAHDLIAPDSAKVTP